MKLVELSFVVAACAVLGKFEDVSQTDMKLTIDLKGTLVGVMYFWLVVELRCPRVVLKKDFYTTHW